MSSSDVWTYLVPALVIGYFVWRGYKFGQVKKQLPDMMQKGAFVLDVRSPAEYASGSSPNSKNIPLSDLPRRVNELPKDRTIILCCASGARSGAAAAILKKHGFTSVVNAGPWTNTV